MSLERPGPVVEVEWVDSFGHGHWGEADTPDELLSHLPCRSAGYLLRDEPDGIVMAQGVGGQGGVLDAMAIPREAIRSLVYLSEPEATIHRRLEELTP